MRFAPEGLLFLWAAGSAGRDGSSGGRVFADFRGGIIGRVLAIGGGFPTRLVSSALERCERSAQPISLGSDVFQVHPRMDRNRKGPHHECSSVDARGGRIHELVEIPT